MNTRLWLVTKINELVVNLRRVKSALARVVPQGVSVDTVESLLEVSSRTEYTRVSVKCW